MLFSGMINRPITLHSAHGFIRFCWGMGGVAGAIIGGSCRLHYPRSVALADFYAQLKDLLLNGLTSSVTYSYSLIIHIYYHAPLLLLLRLSVRTVHVKLLIVTEKVV